MMLFVKGWKLCLESCSSSYIGILCALFFLGCFFFFYAVLLVHESCHKPPLDIHICGKLEVTDGEKSPLTLEDNGNFANQNLQSKRILTFKIILKPQSTFSHRTRKAKGQKHHHVPEAT